MANSGINNASNSVKEYPHSTDIKNKSNSNPDRKSPKSFPPAEVVVFECIINKTYAKVRRKGSHEIKSLNRKVTAMSYLIVNFCKQEKMSVCTADNTNQQTGCSFYEKSRFAERCMYYIFDEYCDCLKAQMSAHTALET